MAYNTEEWWGIVTADGRTISLHQYGWSVTTVGGSRYDIPPRRGSNLPVAYRPGQFHRNKLPDARTITLMMFMVGWEPGTGTNTGGSAPSSIDQRVQWNDNWDFLRRTVYEHYLTDNRVILQRRWRLTPPTFQTVRAGDHIIATDPGVPTPNGQDRIVVANAYCEMSGQMQPTMTGRFRAEFQLDFTLHDPYFYGARVTATLNPGENRWVWNDGHDVASHSGMTIDFVGPLTNPVLRNYTFSPENLVSYRGTIPAGRVVTLDPGRFTALEHAAGATTGVNRIANVVHSGARAWMNLVPGANKLNCTALSGSGHTVVRFLPPYI